MSVIVGHLMMEGRGVEGVKVKRRSRLTLVVVSMYILSGLLGFAGVFIILCSCISLCCYCLNWCSVYRVPCGRVNDIARGTNVLRRQLVMASLRP